MKIGLLGGTFDPIHRQHVEMAKAAQQALDLAEVWFIPVYQPPHKTRTALTSSHHRVAMMELALALEPTFRVEPLELTRERVSYTYETIQTLKAQYPQADFYFLLGADNVEGLATWRERDYLLANVTFVAFERPNHQLTTPYPIVKVPFAKADVSSTAIRAFGQYAALDKAVLRYMLTHHLYGLTSLHERIFAAMPYARFIHTMGVVETASALASRYGLDKAQCELAALLHDYAKSVPKPQLQALMAADFPEQPFIAPIAHAFVGSKLIQTDFGITDRCIIEAVKWHTTGHPEMDEVAKCIFLADYIEPNRAFAGVEVARNAAAHSLDDGVYVAVQQTNAFLRAQGKAPHPDSLALEHTLAQQLTK